MQVRFVLGPAGSGKTYRCLVEIRDALRAAPEGLPLVVLAPKQATFQLERQLLADPTLPGYTRLQILSFERLARLILEESAPVQPKLLDEEGRVMVLRALLAQAQPHLKIFRATVRWPGFARQLSLLLRELQRFQHSPEKLFSLAAKITSPPQLGDKLHDLALLLRAYLAWLKHHQLQDADGLLDLATAALRESAPPDHRPSPLRLAGLWLDGFAEMTPQELDFLAGVIPFCERATLAFCLEGQSREELSWLSTWSAIRQTFHNCYQRLRSLPDCEVLCEVLERRPDQGRFANNPVLQHLEKHWAAPRPWHGPSSALSTSAQSHSPESGDALRRVQEADPQVSPTVSEIAPSNASNESLPATLRIVICPNPEAEAILAAREILGHVRAGGRYRDCAVLLRTLEGHHDVLRRVFRQYEIPFFLDRRESVAHHPLAELIRYGLRTVALNWESDAWFGALKTGLTGADETEIDMLENEALARGWNGDTWKRPLSIPGSAELEKRLERLRQKIVPPFQHLAERLTPEPNGALLAAALREFWTELKVEQQLTEWSAGSRLPTIADSQLPIDAEPSAIGDRPSAIPPRPSAVHETVWEQMESWLDNLALAFPTEPMPPPDWLPILEAGLAGLTVGVIPPALDQVLIGTIDRSRNPELKLSLVLGLNESLFPAAPTITSLLTEDDRQHLEAQGVVLGPNKRAQLGHERYYGYIACTRASQRLVLTCANFDARNRKLNPSLFLDHLQALFPQLPLETWQPPDRLNSAQHALELVPYALKLQRAGYTMATTELLALPQLRSALAKARTVADATADRSLPASLAEALYGRELATSVSGLEHFAACPFKFLVSHGLAAEERKRFELDARERGSFQHEVLSAFHQELAGAGLRWRDLSPAQARERIRRIGRGLLPVYQDGLLWADEARRFTGEVLLESLETLMEVLVGWMAEYSFDPARVEVGFGLADASLPAWRLDLGEGRALALRGRIDRIDLCRDETTGATLAVVLDYKSSGQKPDRLKLHHGLQLQLPAYLATLENLAEARAELGAQELRPAGVFYINLRGEFRSAQSRAEILEDATALRRGYQHTGRYDRAYREKLDRLAIGEQFKLSDRSLDPMDSAAFRNLLERTVENLRRFGAEIFAGKIAPEPYRIGRETACERCDYAQICRFDAWTQPFRSLPVPLAAAKPASKKEKH